MAKDVTKKITSNKSKGEIRSVVCGNCDSETNHKVDNSIEVYWDYKPADVQGTDLYETIHCLGCEQISFRTTSTNSEDYFMDDDGNAEYEEREVIYPNRIKGRTPLKDWYSLPLKIRSIYQQTHSALSTELKILAGVGVRVLLEAVCKEQGAEGVNLAKRVDDLVKKEVLTKRNADILHKLRFLGNDSAHDGEAASDSELEVAFEIVENLLETVYIIPQKSESLVIRKKS